MFTKPISPTTFQTIGNLTVLMAEVFGDKCKQEISKLNNDLSLLKNEVLDTLTGVPYIENNCTARVYVRDGTMLVGIVDARALDIGMFPLILTDFNREYNRGYYNPYSYSGLYKREHPNLYASMNR